MKLREFTNRFRSGDISGAIINNPNEMPYKMALKNYFGHSAYFIDIETFPSGQLTIVDISVSDLLNSEVQGWANHKNPLMEGDCIWLDTEGKRKETVTHVKEGDGSPYPIVTKEGQYKWKDIKLVIKTH